MRIYVKYITKNFLYQIFRNIYHLLNPMQEEQKLKNFLILLSLGYVKYPKKNTVLCDFSACAEQYSFLNT